MGSTRWKCARIAGSASHIADDQGQLYEVEPPWTIYRIFAVTLVVLGLVAPTNGSAVGFGSRAFQLVPDQANIVALYGFMLDGNTSADSSVVVPGSEINVNLGVLQYTHAFELKGQQSAAFGVLPGGRVDGSLDIARQTMSDDNSGLGDAQVGAVFGLTGSPSLPLKQFMEFNPGFAAGILTLFTLPTGQYDESHALNVGANRWAAQFGTVLTWYQGNAMLDPHLRTFELLPSFTLYGDNEDPFGADITGQAAMFNLEGHITQNINQAMFLSVDALYSYGGETMTDEVDNDDRQSALMLGGSFSTMISRSTSIKLSYGEVISRNDNGPDGSMFRAVISVLF